MLINLLIVLGLISLGCSARSLLSSVVYQKDFSQDYLLAKAALERVNPYLPTHELATLYQWPQAEWVGHHPTSHPPPVAVIILPLSLLTYEQAAVLWFLFELICLFGVVILILPYFGKPATLSFTALVTLLLLGWRHAVSELVLGQLTSLLLLLLLGAWQALRSHKATLGGVLLGFGMAL